jgi:hypothetical protein
MGDRKLSITFRIFSKLWPRDMETRLFLSLVVLLFGSGGGVFGQERWHRFISALEQKDANLSFTFLTGVSYFDYDTKAIDNHFPTAEASFDVQFEKKLGDLFRIDVGLRVGVKFSRSPGYDYDSLEVSPEDYQYSLIEVDRVVSEYSHVIIAVPVVMQYTPGKLWLGLGGGYRHYLPPIDYTGYPSDFLAGRHEGGLIAQLSYPLGKALKIRFDYYYGLVNIHPQHTIVVVGPPKTDYKTYSRVAQFCLSYTLGE